jgi:hypothetical protein
MTNLLAFGLLLNGANAAIDVGRASRSEKYLVLLTIQAKHWLVSQPFDQVNHICAEAYQLVAGSLESGLLATAIVRHSHVPFLVKQVPMLTVFATTVTAAH